MRVTSNTTLCVCVALLLLGGCKSEAQDRFDTAADMCSRAAMTWYLAAGMADASDSFRESFCQSNDTAPVSWRFVATGISPGSIDDPPKHFEASWKSKENEHWFRQRGYARMYCLSRV